MSQPSVYYEHSGKFGLTGLLLTLAAGAVVAPLAGVAYGYAVAWNPLIYINFLATLLAAAVVGGAVGGAAKLGKVRNLPLCFVVGVGAGIACQVMQWWATLRFYGLDPSLSAPGEMASMVSALAAVGPWEVFGISPGKWGFMTIWGLEAVIVVLGSASVTLAFGSNPFCERCEKWAETDRVIEPLGFVSDVEALKARVERGDLEALKGFERTEQNGRFSVIELSHCPQCRELRLASLKNVTIKVDKDGKEDRDFDGILMHLKIDGATYDALSKL